MRDKIKSYIDFLFAGAPQNSETSEIKEEILQNTLAYYDDQTDGGKTPEQAYTSAISHIGDINEILSAKNTCNETVQMETRSEKSRRNETVSRIMLAIAICLYVCCVIPVILLGGNLGVCLMFAIAGIATALIIMRPSIEGRTEGKAVISNNPDRVYTEKEDAYRELKKRITGLIFTLTLAAYLIVSFTTNAWFITWVAFPMAAAVSGIIKAIIDLTKGNEK